MKLQHGTGWNTSLCHVKLCPYSHGLSSSMCKVYDTNHAILFITFLQLEVMRLVDHPNLLHFYGTVVQPPFFCIVTGMVTSVYTPSQTKFSAISLLHFGQIQSLSLSPTEIRFITCTYQTKVKKPNCVLVPRPHFFICVMFLILHVNG